MPGSREEKLEEVHGKAEQNAEERLLDLLMPPPRATLEPDEAVAGSALRSSKLFLAAAELSKTSPPLVTPR